MKSNKALLVIDMQKGSFTKTRPRFDAAGVVNRINVLADLFRENQLPVIFIQHDGTTAKEFIPGAKEWELLSDLKNENTDIFIDKYANDCFYQSKLQSRLEELNVNELLITGCATDFCVASTMQSALSKDYNLTVVADGHTTGDRPHLKAEKVIEHYNWVWRNMIPTKGKVRVESFERIRSEIG